MNHERQDMLAAFSRKTLTPVILRLREKNSLQIPKRRLMTFVLNKILAPISPAGQAYFVYK